MLHFPSYFKICVYWDYTPSRELTALFYPLFEYSFFLYVIFDFIQSRLYFKDTIPWLYGFALWTLPIKLVLIAWFRMIFVYQVDAPELEYDTFFNLRGVVGHTLGFFGMQLALLLVSLQNITQILGQGIVYPWLGDRGTPRACYVYMVVTVVVTFFKIYNASMIFMGHPLNINHIWAHSADRIWMILVAVMPLLFAEVSRRTEPYLKITFRLDSDVWMERYKGGGTVSNA